MVDNIESVANQDLAEESPVRKEPPVEELEEEIGEMSRETESPETSEVKEPKLEIPKNIRPAMLKAAGIGAILENGYELKDIEDLTRKYYDEIKNVPEDEARWIHALKKAKTYAKSSPKNAEQKVSTSAMTQEEYQELLGSQKPVGEDGEDLSFDESDPDARKDEFETQYYFGCVVPKGYLVRITGIYREVKQPSMKSPFGLIPQPSKYFKISSIRVMIIGRFKGTGTDIVKLKYIDGQQMGEIYANMNAVIGQREFKENLRSILRLDDDEVKHMTKFFNKCITDNQDLGPGFTAFEHGVAFTENGWTDDTCTQFVAGSRLFKDVNNELVEEVCHFADPAGQDTFKPIGSIDAFLEVSKPLLDKPIAGDRLRYSAYAAASAFLHGPIGVDSFFWDEHGGIAGAMNDKSGSGKSTKNLWALAMYGRVLGTETAYSLTMPASSSRPSIRNKAAKIRDCPMGLGESTTSKLGGVKAAGLDAAARIKIVYMLTEPNEDGRAKDGKGGIQVARQLRNTILSDGEDPFVPTDGEIGSRVRTPGVRGGLGVSSIGDVVAPVKYVALHNSGWFIDKFIAKIYKYRGNIKQLFTRTLGDYNEMAGEDDMAKRQAAYGALIETAGWLVEEMFSDVGLPKKPARDIAHAMWKEHLASNVVQPQWYLGLDDIWDWVNVNYDAHFAIGQHVTTRWGWFVADSNGQLRLNLMKEPVETMLESRSKSTDSIFESFRVRGITNTLAPKPKKNGSPGKPPLTTNATFDNKTKQVYQINITKLYEELELGIPPQGLASLSIMFNSNNQITSASAGF